MDETAKAGAIDIAVVGMACRFPGDATDPEKLWAMLEKSTDVWQDFPRDRFNLPGWYHPDPNRQGSFNIRGAHLLKGDIAEFDAPFFSISTSEATSMDPQQRLLLEVTYEALDSAGIPAESLRNTATGVWCGSFVRDYEQPLMRDPDTTPPHAATGTGIAILANRVSHVFDLAGTSQTIDTGCSASMICIHQACRSLASGESSLGIAAGVGLIFSPNTLVPMANLSILGPDGRCFTFDERANGYGRGEGVGVVVLKRVEDALRDNDTIRAVIRATRSNQDGHTQGLTLPSMERQIDNMTAAYASAGLSVDRTGYVECHGTGTQAGDFLEVHAVSESLCRDRSESQPLIIGSVKTNIGHLEGSAGVAGLMKGVLAVEKGRIPKHANFNTPNPKIDFAKLKVKVPTEAMNWPTTGLRRASVNSFGFGGTNAHAVVDDAAHYLEELGVKGQHNTILPIGDSAETSTSSSFQRTQLFVFSGRDEGALARVLASQTEYVKLNKSAKQFSANYAYTLFSRRSRMECRTFAVAQSGDELLRKLQSGDTHETHRQRKGEAPRIALVFCGQGAQWHAMGRELMEYDVFRSSMAAASRYLQSDLRSTFCLLDELRLDKELSQVHQARVAQPAATAIQVALVDLLRASNIDPVAVVGHSSGEIAAAYAIGAISREDAWKIAFHRGRCAERLTIESPVTGAMLAVSLSEADVQPYLDKVAHGAVDVACVNGPASITLSGNERQIIQLQALLAADRVQVTRVRVKTAYHSHHMEHIMGDYLQSIRDVQPRPTDSATVMYSSVSQVAVDAKKLNARYWVRNLVAPVQFFGAVKCMVAESDPSILVEVGPHRVWESVLRQIVSHVGGPSTIDSYLSLLRRGRDAAETTLEVMGALWQRGCPVKLDWAMASKLETMPRHLVDVPSYPWDHSRRYWSESYLSKANRFRSHGREDLIGAPLENSPPQEPCWRGFFRLRENPWIEDHVIQKAILYPAGGLLAMAIEAAKQMADPDIPIDGFEVTSFKILKPVLIPSTTHGLEHMLRAKLLESGSYEFSILSQPTEGAWTVHATGQFAIKYKSEPDELWLLEWALRVEEYDMQRLRYYEAKDRCKTQLVPRQFYERIDVIGMSYGPQFRNIVRLRKGSDACCSNVQIPDTKSRMPCQFEFDHVIHPATLDAMLQTVIPLGEEAMLPTSVDSIFVSVNLPRGAGAEFEGYTTARPTGYREASAEIVMFADDTDDVAVVIKGLHLRSLPPTTDGVGFLPTNRNLCSEVVWKLDADSAKFSSAREVIDSMGHQKPSMTVCQLSGGLQTARWVTAILAGGYTTPRFSKYTLVGIGEEENDLSLSTFAERSCLERIEAPKDEASLLDGGQRYDLILLAADQSHDLGAYAKIIKPQGRLIFQLDSQPSPSQLDQIATALQTGDMRYENLFDRPENGHSFIIARHIPPKMLNRTETKRIYLLLPAEMSDLLRSFKDLLCGAFGRLGIAAMDITLESISNMQRADFAQPFVSLLEMNSPFLFSLSEGEFSPMHRLLDSAKSLLWLTRGAQMRVAEPRCSPFLGLARTLRSEDAKRNIVSLDFASGESLGSDATVEAVISVFCRSFSQSSSAALRDTEFSLQDGRLFIPRLVTLPVLNSMIEHRSSRPQQVTELPLAGDGRNAKLDVEVLCKTNRALFVDDDEASRPLWANQVRIAVEETYLQPSDKDALTGETALEIGMDVFGTVVEIGSNVCNLRESDKVVAIVKGTIKTSVVVSADLVRKANEVGPYSPTALMTAIYGLHEVGRVSSDDNVLILDAASPNGQTAIHVARMSGCRIMAGFSTRAQFDVLLQIPGLAADQIVNTSHPTFVRTLRELMLRKGFDVVFSPNPNYVKEALECVGDGGHVAQVASGALDLSGIRIPNNIHFETFDIQTLLKRRPRLMSRLSNQLDIALLPRFLKPLCGRKEYDFSQVLEATQSLAQDPYLGIHVLRANATTQVKFPIALSQPTELDPAATYVVVGGLGGLGRSIAYFLAEKGVKHMAILSRSRANGETGAFVRSLAKQGVNIRAVPADICDEQALREALQRIQAAMPKIKGVVQCAAVIDDAVFSKMDYSQWHRAVAPKTTGSWNLHQLLPDDLDFFIMLSSSSGVIGNRCQANYAAGNSFQDALAHYRAAQGQHTVSLDLGVVLEAGMVAREEKLLDMMRAAGFFGMRLDDFRLVLQRAMTAGGATTEPRLPPQVVMAVGTGGLTRQNKPSDPFWARTALFAYLNTVDAPPTDEDDAAATTGAGGLREAIIEAPADGDASAAHLLYPALVAALARRKGMVPADFEPHRGFDAYGIDSMDSIFLLGWIAREVGVSVQTLDRLTIWELCVDVARRVKEEAGLRDDGL